MYKREPRAKHSLSSNGPLQARSGVGSSRTPRRIRKRLWGKDLYIRSFHTVNKHTPPPELLSIYRLGCQHHSTRLSRFPTSFHFYYSLSALSNLANIHP